jgi:hypothetical protein
MRPMWGCTILQIVGQGNPDRNLESHCISSFSHGTSLRGALIRRGTALFLRVCLRMYTR